MRRGRTVSRRTILKAALGTGAIVAGGGALLGLRKGDLASPPPGSSLTPSETAIMAAVLRVFIADAPGRPTTDDVGAVATVGTILKALDETAVGETRQLIALVENALPNFLFALTPKPFTRMSREEQERAITAWGESALSLRRAGYLALHALAYASYYASEATWPSVNYPGPPPGIFDPQAPVWNGMGPRPASLGRATDGAP